jgi:anti-sigma factor RsiW
MRRIDIEPESCGFANEAPLVRAPRRRALLPARPPELRAVLGFEVALWREGDLGYALVSDVDRAELASFAARLTSPGASPPE